MTECLWEEILKLDWDDKPSLLLEHIKAGTGMNRYNSMNFQPWNQCNRALAIAGKPFRVVQRSTGGDRPQKYVCLVTTSPELAVKNEGGTEPVSDGEISVAHYMSRTRCKPRVPEHLLQETSSYGGATTGNFFGRKVLTA